MRVILGFMACATGLVLALIAAHGAVHLTNNTWAVVIFLGVISFVICLFSAIVASGLKLATGHPFARTWWMSLAPIASLALAALYTLEITVGR